MTLKVQERSIVMKDTALIVIDMQRGFISEKSSCYIKGAAATVPDCAKMIRGCREQGIPVIFVNRLYRENGSDVEHTRLEGWLRGGKPISPNCMDDISADMPEEFEPQDGDYMVKKPRFSAFFQTELDMLLRRLGVKNVVLIGTTTPNCIRTTCYDGISLDYNVVVISNCTSSATDEIQKANLKDMENIGAQVMTSREFLSGKKKIKDTAGIARKYVQG